MKGTVLTYCIQWEHLFSVSLSKSPEAKYTKWNADLLPPPLSLSFSFLPECQDRKVFAFYVLFTLWKGNPALYLMNLLTGPALPLRSSQYEISTYHSSQLTEHETCQEHYGELKNFISWWDHWEQATTTEIPQVHFGKTRWYRLYRLWRSYPESRSPEEKIVNLV